MRKRFTVVGRVRGSAPSGLLAFVMVAAVSSCVGSETDRESGRRARAGAEGSASDTAAAFTAGPEYWDSIPTLQYQLFEQEEASADPRKAVYRFMVLERSSREAYTKTLRLALDSIGRTVPDLAAARAVLYVFIPTAENRGRLLPATWGEWVPQEGWEGAGAGGGRGFHRTYLYNSDPGWAVADSAGGEAGQSR